jgi:hypothetical protein
MQKIFPIFLFLAIGAFAQAQAQPEHGIPVRVKLLSGAEQDAELLRVARDTVFLGGSIDGKFTVVRLHKNAFAWIGDSSGAHLNLDSLQQAGMATAPADTAAAEQHPEWKGKVLIFPTEYRAIDSALASRVSDITKQMFLDKGKHTVPLSRADYASCKTTDCVFAEVRKNGASAVILESIRPAKSQDSIVLGMSFCDFAAGNCGTDSAVLSSRSATEELLKGNRFINLFAKATGDSSAQAGGSAPDAKQRRKNISYIAVETDPEEATLARKGGDALCHTPCTIAVRDTERIALETYWSVDRHLWAAKASVLPIPGDTAKISLRLSRVNPEVEIRTNPSGADIFTDASISVNSRSIGKTPKVYATAEPGPTTLHLWKEGFRDTLVTFHVNAIGNTTEEINLSALTDPQAIDAQKTLLRTRKKRFLGFTLMGTSIAPVVAGGILLHLAGKDYSRARDIRDELELPSSAQGAKYQEKVKDNRHYADRGDKEAVAGGICFGAAAALVAIGWAIAF